MPKQRKDGVAVLYRDEKIPCQICGREFKNHQGLYGHMRIVHGAIPGDVDINQGIALAPQGGSATRLPRMADPPKDVPSLKREVEALKLEQEKEQLLAGRSKPARPLDMAEQIGLGGMQPDVQGSLQARAFGVANAQLSMVDKLLGNPEAMKIAIAGIKSILGSNGGGEMGILKSLGYGSLRELIDSTRSPVAPSGMKIAGLDLSGVAMTPETVKELLGYDAIQKELASKAQDRQQRQEMFDSVIKRVGSAVLDGMMTGTEEGEIEAQPGGSHKMRGKNITGTGPSLPPMKVKPDKDLQVLLRCSNPECQQVLDVTGITMNEDVVCPSCGLAQRLSQPNEPIRPVPQPSEATKADKLLYDNQTWDGSAWIEKGGRAAL